MIVPNFQTVNLQECMVNGTMCFDISNNLSQETANNNDDVIDYENLCNICLENIHIKKISLSCEHRYHIPCIIKWFNLQLTNNRNPSCPYCKQLCDFENLVKTRISTNLIEVKNIVDQLDFLVKNCKPAILREYHIISLRRNYIKLKSSLTELHEKGVKEPTNCPYIYISKISLSINILQLITAIEVRKNREAILKLPKNNRYLKQYIIKKMTIPINYILKCINTK